MVAVSAYEWFWMVLIGLDLQAVLLVLVALSSSFDDAVILRAAMIFALVDTVVFMKFGLPLSTSLAAAASGPLLALVMCVANSPRGALASRGPFSDLLAQHGCTNVISPRRPRRMQDAKPLARMLCGERFEPSSPYDGAPMGSYIASTIVIGGELCDVDLCAVLGWLPREPWDVKLTDEEVGAITFASRPAPPIAELLELVDSGEFFIHPAFGERNLRGYLVANAPDLLEHLALRPSHDRDVPRYALWNANRMRAMNWAWALGVAVVLPVVFAWAALAAGALG